MFIIFRLFFILVMIPFLMIMFLLHSFHHFLFFYVVAQNFKEIDHNHIFIYCFPKRILHPFIRLAPNIDEQIAGRYLQNIVCSRLIAVKIHAFIQKHCHFHAGGIVTQDIHHPVIFGENGCHDLNFIIPGCISIATSASAAAGRKTACHQNNGHNN